MAKEWSEAGTEPPVSELLEDPIAELLRRRDGIGEREVWQAVRRARLALIDPRRAA